MPKSEINSFCRRIGEIIEAIVKQNPAAREFEVEGFKGTKFEELETVSFVSYGGGAQQVNPNLNMEEAFSAKLRDKDSQLPSHGYERILLAVNWVMFAGALDAISALATMNLDFMARTDRIYIESSPGEFALVYDRSVRSTLDAMEDPPTDDQRAALYQAWLENRIGDPKAYRMVRDVSARMGNVNWISNKHTRERIVWHAVELVKSGQVEEGLWVSRQFRKDPDPPISNEPNVPGAPPSLHEQIKAGEHVAFISSVRGSVCWLLQRLVAHAEPDLFPQILAMVEELARDENLYVRQQATVPLSELARRRWWTDTEGRFLMDGACRIQTRNLAFEMLRDNRESPAILDSLGSVFDSLRDVNETEAELILDVFSTVKNCRWTNIFPALLIYFAAYRQDHFRELGRFDSGGFKKRLLAAMHHGPRELRISLAWHFQNSFQGNVRPEEFAKLKEFVLEIPRGPYDKEVFFQFFVLTSSLPAELRAELGAAVSDAITKEETVDPNRLAFSDAEMMRLDAF